MIERSLHAWLLCESFVLRFFGNEKRALNAWRVFDGFPSSVGCVGLTTEVSFQSFRFSAGAKKSIGGLLVSVKFVFRNPKKKSSDEGEMFSTIFGACHCCTAGVVDVHFFLHFSFFAFFCVEE